MAVHRIKKYNLRFNGTDWEGHEVCVRGVNYGQFIQLDSLDVSSENIEEVNELIVSKLVSWNLEMPVDDTDDDSPLVPVPTTLEGLKSVDPLFVMALVDEWVSAVTSVSDPLGQSSSAGATFPVASIPMETLSPSHMSSPMPSSPSGSAVPSTFSPAPS